MVEDFSILRFQNNLLALYEVHNSEGKNNMIFDVKIKNLELFIYDFSYAKCVGIQSPLHFHALQIVGCCAGCNAGRLGQVEHAEPGGGDRQITNPCWIHPLGFWTKLVG